MREQCQWVSDEDRRDGASFVLSVISDTLDFGVYESVAQDCGVAAEEFVGNRFWKILDEEFRGIPALEQVATIFTAEMDKMPFRDVAGRGKLFARAQKILEKYLQEDAPWPNEVKRYECGCRLVLSGLGREIKVPCDMHYR